LLGFRSWVGTCTTIVSTCIKMLPDTLKEPTHTHTHTHAHTHRHRHTHMSVVPCALAVNASHAYKQGHTLCRIQFEWRYSSP